jgi:radical SAM protein with 4Fe4S-binding SPASM domain
MTACAPERAWPLQSCLWELTLRCNLQCLHCGSGAGRARRLELSPAERFELVDDLADLGCRELAFIGGEIFLCEGWEQVARRASDRGLRVNLMTNGYRVGERELDQVRHARLVNVGVSIDGMEDTHNRIRRRPDSFASVARTYDLLFDAGIASAAITSLMAWNLPDLEPLYQFLLQHHVQLWQLQLVNPMGNMASRRELILDPAHVASLIEFIREKNCERRMIVIAADSVGYYHEDSEPCIRGRRGPICCWEGCQAGLSTIFLDSVGNVKGCGALYDDAFIEGNVRDRRLSDIWSDPRSFAYNRAFEMAALSGGCRDCDVADVCRGGCRASNYFATGRLHENAFCPRSRARSARRIPPRLSGLHS